MSKIALSGDASGTGTFTIASPNSNSNFTLTLPQATTTVVGTDATQTLTNKTIDASQLVAASVTTTQLATAVKPLGVGQTWSDVTASRALSTTYTNSTGRSIYIAIIIAANGSWSSNLVVDGKSTAGNYFISGGGTMTMCSIVPSGQTYSATSGAPLSSWLELR